MQTLKKLKYTISYILLTVKHYYFVNYYQSRFGSHKDFNIEAPLLKTENSVGVPNRNPNPNPEGSQRFEGSEFESDQTLRIWIRIRRHISYSKTCLKGKIHIKKILM